MIEVCNISKHYTVQGKKKVVFQNLSLKIPRGGRFALMGKNGAGKSTLLRILCGVERPNSGSVRISSSLSWPVGIGGGFIPNLTGRENIKFVCRLYMNDKQETRRKIEFVQDFAELGGYFDMPLKTYSSGMRSRLAFGLSMAFDFDFYIVDEAMSAGDSAFRNKSKIVFDQKAKQSGIIMVSHSIGTIREYCDQGIFLHDNTVTVSDNIEDIITLYNDLAKPKPKPKPAAAVV